jgi:hypothetical protein
MPQIQQRGGIGMRDKSYSLGTIANFLTLLIGLVIGFAFGGYYADKHRVWAQEQKVEEITPIMTVGSAAIGTILAGRIATDDIMVKGTDLVKLLENTLNLLGSKPLLFNKSELQAVLDQSRAAIVLRMKQPEGPKKEEKK